MHSKFRAQYILSRSFISCFVWFLFPGLSLNIIYNYILYSFFFTTEKVNTTQQLDYGDDVVKAVNIVTIYDCSLHNLPRKL